MSVTDLIRQKILDKGFCPFCLTKLKTPNIEKGESTEPLEIIIVNCICSRKYIVNPDAQKYLYESRRCPRFVTWNNIPDLI